MYIHSVTEKYTAEVLIEVLSLSLTTIKGNKVFNDNYDLSFLVTLYGVLIQSISLGVMNSGYKITSHIVIAIINMYRTEPFWNGVFLSRSVCF